MKVGVPTLGDKGWDEKVGEHFGRVPTYTIYDTESGEISVIPNSSEHMGGSGFPAEILAREGVDVMLCGGLGARAVAMFESFGVEVYVGASGTVRDTIEAWKAGKLQMATADNCCPEGHHHGHHHEHHHRESH